MKHNLGNPLKSQFDHHDHQIYNGYRPVTLSQIVNNLYFRLFRVLDDELFIQCCGRIKTSIHNHYMEYEI